MLTKQVCRYNDKKKDVEWIEVPVEKTDIAEYIEKHIETIESYFKYHKYADFFDTVVFLRHCVLVFGELDILTHKEVKEYLLKYHELENRYMELKKE